MTQWASKRCIQGCTRGVREDSEKGEKANAALLQEVRDLQGQVMAGQTRLQEAAANIAWQQRRTSQLQEELRMQGELQEVLEEELQARSSAALPTGGGMDAVFDAMAFTQHVAQEDRKREASQNVW